MSQKQPETADEQDAPPASADERPEQEQAMEKAQEEAAHERESERGYQ